MVDFGTAELTLEMVQASQLGMRALGAALAVGLTGIASGICGDDDRLCCCRSDGREP